MSEERLYKLAYEALLERWSRRYEDVQNHPPVVRFFYIRGKGTL